MGAHESARLRENYHAKQQGPALGPQEGAVVMQGSEHLGARAVPRVGGKAPGREGAQVRLSCTPQGNGNVLMCTPGPGGGLHRTPVREELVRSCGG